jgi:hypothetical protein
LRGGSGRSRTTKGGRGISSVQGSRFIGSRFIGSRFIGSRFIGSRFNVHGSGRAFLMVEGL